MTAAIRSSSTQMGLQVGGVEYATLDSTGLVVPAATTSTQAVQLQQVAGGYPAVAFHATAMDIFAVAGTAKSISGTGTLTALPNCPSAFVGMQQTIIPSNAAGFSITASASLVVDGATSGNHPMPQNAVIQIIATSTTTFKITTISAQGSWTPIDASGAGLTFSAVSGSWVRVGPLYTCRFALTYPTTASGTTASVGGLPATAPNIGANSISGYISVSTATITMRGVYSLSGTAFNFDKNNGAAQATNADLSLTTNYGVVVFRV